MCSRSLHCRNRGLLEHPLNFFKTIFRCLVKYPADSPSHLSLPQDVAAYLLPIYHYQVCIVLFSGQFLHLSTNEPYWMDRRLHTLAVCRALSDLYKDHLYTLSSGLYRISGSRKDTQWYSSDTRCIYPQVLIIRHLFHESGSPEQGSFWHMPDQHSADT